MAEKTEIEKFEEMLRSPGRPAIQDMYLDLFRAWMALHFMRTVTAAELAERMVAKKLRQRRNHLQGCRVANKTLLLGLVEIGIATADHNELDVRTYKLTHEGLALVERLRDVIKASKDRPVTGDWDLDHF